MAAIIVTMALFSPNPIAINCFLNCSAIIANPMVWPLELTPRIKNEIDRKCSLVAYTIVTIDKVPKRAHRVRRLFLR